MSLFKYHDDGTDSRPGGSSRSRSNGAVRHSDVKAGPSYRTIEDMVQEEDYDMQAALEIEQAEEEDDWEPHHHLYESHLAPTKASSSRGPDLPKQEQKQQYPSKSNGKARQIFEIDDDEDEEDEAEMIPVPIDAEGAIVSDARIEEVSFVSPLHLS